MATTIRELLIGVGFEVDDKELDDLDEKIETAKEAWSDFGVIAKRTAKFFAIATGAVAAAVAVASLSADAALKGAQRTGLQTDAYRGLADSAKKGGASVEQFEQAVKFANKSVADATQGNEIARKRLLEFGISARDAEGNLKSADKVILEAADHIASLKTPTEQAAAAQRLFGEEAGPRLVPMLRLGSAGIQEQQARFIALAGEVEASADSFAVFNDTIRDLRSFVVGLATAFSETLLPGMQGLIDLVLDIAVRDGPKFRKQLALWGKALGFFFKILDTGLTLADKLVQATVGSWGPLFGVAVAGAVALGAAIGGVLLVVTGIAGLGALSASLLALDAALIAAGISLSGFLPLLGLAGSALLGMVLPLAALTLALLIFEDIIVGLRGGESVFNDLQMAIGEMFGGSAISLEETGRLLGLLLDDVVAFVDDMQQSVIDGFDKLVAFGILAFEQLDKFTGGVASRITDAFMKAFDFVTGGLGKISKLAGGAGGFLKGLFGFGPEAAALPSGFSAPSPEALAASSVTNILSASPGVRGAAGASNVTSSTQRFGDTNVNIQAAPGEDSAELAAKALAAANRQIREGIVAGSDL